MNTAQKQHSPTKAECDIMLAKEREEAHKAYRAAVALVAALERIYGFSRKKDQLHKID